MNPQNGSWAGTFTTQGGTTVYVVLVLHFANNKITGSFNVGSPKNGVWTGPRSGNLSAGAYTAAGDIQMKATVGQDTASFDGIYASDGDSQVIQGEVIIAKGNNRQIGTLVVYSAELQTGGAALSAHVWGE